MKKIIAVAVLAISGALAVPAASFASSVPVVHYSSTASASATGANQVSYQHFVFAQTYFGW